MASKVFWLTMDAAGKIWIWQYRCHPYYDEGGQWMARVCCYDQRNELPMCEGGLALFTGITLKPGQKKKFRLVEV